MPNTEENVMDRGFEWRLKAALDRVTPPAASPRYASTAMGGARAWRLGPALVAAGATMVLLAITATAATGSPNPVIWAERAGTTIQSVGHTPEASPSSQPTLAPQSAPAAPAQPQHDTEHDKTQAPERTESPESRETNEPPEAPESSSHSDRSS